MTHDQLIEQEFAKVRGNLETLQKQISSMGGPCAKCRHFKEEEEYGQPYCWHPVYIQTSYSAVTGETRQRPTVYARAARGYGQLCGLQGALFQPWTRWEHIRPWLKGLAIAAMMLGIPAGCIALIH